MALRLAPPAPFLPEKWHGKPIVGLVVCHSGADPEADLAPVRALGDPIVDLVTEKPYAEQQSMLDGMEPTGNHHYWKTEYLGGLSAEFLDNFRDSALKVTSPLSDSIVIHLAGALNERADDDGAVGNRDARYMTAFAGQWPADVPDDEHVAWVREAWTSVRPFSTGGNYLNFQTADEEEERIRATYGANIDRLVEVKGNTTPTTYSARTGTSVPEPEPGRQGRHNGVARVDRGRRYRRGAHRGGAGRFVLPADEYPSVIADTAGPIGLSEADYARVKAEAWTRSRSGAGSGYELPRRGAVRGGGVTVAPATPLERQRQRSTLTTGSFEDVRTATVNGITLAYREQGEGEPVVFVHGTASDLRTWERQLPALRGADRRAIAYSRRYARPNEDIEPGADDQMLPHVDDLIALLHAIDAAPAHLVGDSWGAFICLLTAIREPRGRPNADAGRAGRSSPSSSALHQRPTELFRLLVRRPRTALAIVKFGAGTMSPAQKAFRRGDDEAGGGAGSLSGYWARILWQLPRNDGFR